MDVGTQYREYLRSRGIGQVRFTVTVELRKRIDRERRERKITLNDLMAEALENYFKKHKESE
jgi:hypothetical protein